MHALERKELVRRERRSSVAGETEYAFRHVLIRDVAYGQIPRADGPTSTACAADWIESLGRPEDHAELLAHHYLAALELARAASPDQFVRRAGTGPSRCSRPATARSRSTRSPAPRASTARP